MPGQILFVVRHDLRGLRTFAVLVCVGWNRFPRIAPEGRTRPTLTADLGRAAAAVKHEAPTHEGQGHRAV